MSVVDQNSQTKNDQKRDIGDCDVKIVGIHFI